eukprot:contig_33879_g8170
MDGVLSGSARGVIYRDLCLAVSTGVRQALDECIDGVPAVTLRSTSCATNSTFVRVREDPSGTLRAWLLGLRLNSTNEQDYFVGSDLIGWGTVPRSDGVSRLRGDLAIARLFRNGSRLVLTM